MGNRTGLVDLMPALIALIVVLWAPLATADPLTQPMRARNLSPPIAIFGVPTWEGGLDTGQSARFAVIGNVASHFQFAEAGAERLTLDGETWRLDFVYERRVSEAWSVTAALPLIRNSGGVLDDFIDAWHSVFNLPDGKRNSRPENEIQFFYDDGPGPSYFRSQAATGLGDLMLSAARTAGRDGSWRLELSVKLPTGDTDLLMGSGAADVAVSLLHRGASSWASHPAGWFWGAGLLRIGQPDRFPAQSNDWVGLGMVGVSWQPFARLGLKAQLDLHSAYYDSHLEQIGNAAMQATLGGWWAIDEQRVLTIAVIEDLVVRAAPDVSLQIGFEWKL